jgi:hypothetical protein
LKEVLPQRLQLELNLQKMKKFFAEVHLQKFAALQQK